MRAGQKGRRKNPTRSEGGGGGGETVEKRARGRGRVRKEWREGKKEKGGEKYEKKKKKRGEARDIMRATRLVPASFTVLYQLRVNDIQRLIPRPNPLRLYASPRLASRHACVSNQPPVYHSLHLLSRFLFFIFFFLLAIITRAISRASNFLPSLSSCRLFFTNFFSFYPSTNILS